MNVIDFYNYGLVSIKSNSETWLIPSYDNVEELKESREWLPLSYFDSGHQEGDLTKNTIIYEQEINSFVQNIILTPYIVYTRNNVGDSLDLSASFYDIYFKIGENYYYVNETLNIQNSYIEARYEGVEGNLYNITQYINFVDNKTLEIIFNKRQHVDKMYVVARGVSITEPSLDLPVNWATIYGYASFSGLTLI